VVAADRAALPETCGDAALLVDPDDPRAVAEALTSAVFDPGVRDRLIAAGHRRAAGFSWDRSAAELDALLRATAAAGTT
jgi:glycosyltransferase involved in cell wall biosynthesis